jgi:uncharacterized protein (DUF2345 family)
LTFVLCGSFAHGQNVAASGGTDVTALNVLIKARGGRWVAGETSVSRLPLAHQGRLAGLGTENCVPSMTPTAPPAPKLSAPTSLDWRSNGGNYVTSIKNQGSCGSCWAFATTGALESATLIAAGQPNIDLDLSEQTMLSCSGGGNCEAGGYIDDASEYARNTGLPLETCYPYTGSDGTCSSACANWQQSAYKIQNWHWIYHAGTHATVDILKSELATYGPLVTTMAVYSDFFYYTSGVYAYASGYMAGYHAIIIVGYDDPGQYFIVKNSWGTGWGEQGFFRIAYSELNSVVGFGGRACGTIGYEATTQAYTTLSVSKAGTGSGTVTSYPQGIDCGATCSAQYANGTQVTLTAQPDANATFAGWSGACSGTGTCSVTMDATKSATATFALVPVNPTLSVTKSGSGSGTVTSYPQGIDCGATCSAQYANGTQVTLTAQPDGNSTFAGWSGACWGTGTCNVMMSASMSVTATFALVPVNQTLSVTKNGSGSGTVTSSPAGINCGTTCSASFTKGTVVTLTPTPDANATFTGWSGACSGTGTCSVTMDATKSATATFNAGSTSYVGCFTDDNNRALPAYLSLSGYETVESCKQMAAAAGYAYAGLQYYGQCFGGDALGYAQVADSECDTPCNANPSEMCGGPWRNSIYRTSVTPSNPTLSVTKSGSGSGTVTSSPAGINCGTTCSAQYANGTQVTLTAQPDGNSTFAGWSGACSGTGTCNVMMDAVKSVVATFDIRTAGYVGCFTDDANRALPVQLGNGETVESCTQQAAAAGYAYAGVQWYGECWVGNTLGYTQVADSECNTPCNANPSEMCGGAWRNSIYRTGR